MYPVAPAAAAAPPSLELEDIKSAIDKRLFIGRVPPEVTEADVFAVFSLYGALTEVRRMPGTNIAFVGYETWARTHKALINTDGKLQFGEGSRPCVVSFAERTGQVGRKGGIAYQKGMDLNRVFVGGLPEDTTDQEISQRFGAMGSVQGVNLLPKKPNVRRRCAYVSFELWGEALDAIEHLHGDSFREGSEAMQVTLAQPKEPGMGQHSVQPPLPNPLLMQHYGGAANGGAGVYGNGYGQLSARASSWDEQQPVVKRSRFSNFGGGQQQTAEFQKSLSAYTAALWSTEPRSTCDVLHEQLMQMRELVSAQGIAGQFSSAPTGGPQAAPRGQTIAQSEHASALKASEASTADRENARLFIGGLSPDATDEDLANLAGQVTMKTSADCCRLLECRVLQGKGCGYLRFVSAEAAEEVLQALAGQYVEAWQGVLRVQWAAPARPTIHENPKEHWQVGYAAERPPDAAAGIGHFGETRPMFEADYAKDWMTQDQVEAMGCEPTRLFVGQLAKDPSVGPSLSPVFESYGQLLEFKWVLEKGILYVSYASFMEAQTALQALSGQAVLGISRGMSVTYARRR